MILELDLSVPVGVVHELEAASGYLDMINGRADAVSLGTTPDMLSSVAMVESWIDVMNASKRETVKRPMHDIDGYAERRWWPIHKTLRPARAAMNAPKSSSSSITWEETGLAIARQSVLVDPPAPIDGSPKTNIHQDSPCSVTTATTRSTFTGSARIVRGR